MISEASVCEISAWVIDAGLTGQSEVTLVDGFCDRLVAGGVPLWRAVVIIDTLHPIHEGRASRWARGKDQQTELVEYGSTSEGAAAANWRATAFYRMLQSGETVLRRRICAGEDPEFPQVVELAAQGSTDYLALIHRFAADHVIGEMDCVYSHWTSDAPDGFSEADVETLLELAPALSLAVKCVSLTRILETLGETYLGRDAGRRVLSGRIGRGSAERMDTVLWYSDLRGYTGITDNADPEQIIPLLNDYAEAVVPAIHEHEGDVLKFIGDGILAIFAGADRERACCLAIAAEDAVRQRVHELNQRRAAQGLTTTHVYLGLHVGEVFYGNIGSSDRLDFTVVGPAVNEVARIAAMCRSAERDVLISSGFAAAVGTRERQRILSVGRYALRGVRRPQELFTLIPEEDLPESAGSQAVGAA